MKHHLRLFICALALSALPVSLQADTIDLFNNPGSAVQTSNIAAGGGNPMAAGASEFSALADVLAGRRSITTLRTAGSGSVAFDVNTSVAGGLAASTGFSTSSTSTVTWDYAKGGLILDFTAAGFLLVDNIDIDVGQVDFSFTLSDGVNEFTTPTQSLVGGVTDQDLLFPLAGVPAGILGSVAQLRFNVTTFSFAPGAGTDLAVDGISTQGPIKQQEGEIPEPASLALCAFFALAAALCYVRRRWAAA